LLSSKFPWQLLKPSFADLAGVPQDYQWDDQGQLASGCLMQLVSNTQVNVNLDYTCNKNWHLILQLSLPQRPEYLTGIWNEI